MKWTWTGEFWLSDKSYVYEVQMQEKRGVALVVTGAFATRYDWLVVDLKGFEHDAGRGWVQITRIGNITPSLRNTEHFLQEVEPPIAAGYIKEKFPGFYADKEYQELGTYTIPFLTRIFSVTPEFLDA